MVEHNKSTHPTIRPDAPPCILPKYAVPQVTRSIPQNVEKLNGAGIAQIECGAQFSLALSRSGLVWTWGKGDYFRLGHGADQHVRKPTVVECLRGKKIIHVAVGALHCLAVGDTGQVFAWGDNDHGQQGNATTAVNRKPALVHGNEGSRISRVACGSSHSVAWTTFDAPSSNCHEPVLFAASKDSLGAGFVGNNSCLPSAAAAPAVAAGTTERRGNAVSNGAANSALAEGGGVRVRSALEANAALLHGGGGVSSHISASHGKKSVRPSLSRILLSLESNSAKQQALQHVLNGMQILCARDAVVAVLAPHGSTPGCAIKKAEAAAASGAGSATVTPAGTLTMEVAEVSEE